MPAARTHVALPARYRVVRHLANGGMASVYAADDERLERLVAVKVLAPAYAADPTARHRFTREARAAARVSDHPHVVTIYDVGETTDTPPQAFIIMEHFAGGTVADRLKRGTPIAVPTALRWLAEAASALDAAHAADVVHRDVKPGNLLLDERGRLAVGDFGIASIVGETQVTQAGQVLGTAAYLSPEQARGHAATSASDIYSLAVVAYELLCGHRPFGGETPMAQARARLEAEPPAATGPCQAAAAALAEGLARDPDHRPPTATAFVDGVRTALGEHATPRRPPAPTAATAPVPSPPRSRRGPVLAALALFVAAAGTAAAFLVGGGGGGGRDTPATTHVAASARTTTADRRATATTTAATATTQAATPPATATSPPATASTPAPAPAADAAALNNAGFAKLEAGDVAGALPLLEQARAAFQAKGDASSLDYAYNLYNLAVALRLSGRPAEAIPLLQERLRISSFKRGVVRKELRTAQRAAGVAG